LEEHRKAAEQYLAAAALVQDDPGNRIPHARVAWSAAQALQSAGLAADALPAFRRAAELWGELGNVPARVRCLRSAAWLLGRSQRDADTADTTISTATTSTATTGTATIGTATIGSWPQGIAAMRAVLAELAALPKEERSEVIEAEIGNTIEQLDQMLVLQRNAEAEQEPTPSGDGAE
jgi:hypothetical protein